MKNQKNLAIFIILGGIVISAIIFFFLSTGKKPVIKTNDSVVNSQVKSDFLGEKGETVEALEGKIYIDEKEVNDGNMHSFNYFSKEKNKTIYFFIVKASDGTYRAAANACKVCFDAKKGFSQVGDLIRCENCQVTYSKDKIALEKGGCNPGPIDKDAKVENGKLVITTSDIEQVAYLF